MQGINENLRDTFKSWAQANGLCTIRLSNGEYSSKPTRMAWIAFNAGFNLFK
ncbi:Uncharacterised protein [Neisseria animaloris]|uniref:hypothetical protein n=1 Tax=Neisseria animaloris TaxID=326522 RepID=UPI000F709671|nr:hypothetical protein [Neisseria animaloris]VEH86542.1 Uncharacterised protein [Neisseria animaloris]